jgi:NTP pyrophosphatase (non-canonical NTP hydrolase)
MSECLIETDYSQWFIGVKDQLSSLAGRIGTNSKEKGFWNFDKNKNEAEISQKLLLVITELSEATEARRCGKTMDNVPQEILDAIEHDREISKDDFEKYIKDTFEDELADSLIRLLDICFNMDVKILRHVIMKMNYNKTRERMHGKKFG